MISTLTPVETGGGTAVDGSGARRWPWARLRDLAFVSLGVLGAASLVVGEGPVADFAARTWLQALGTLVLAVALWWRRRYPVHVALLGCVVGAAGGSWLPVWLALLTVAIRHRDRWLVLVLCAAAVALVVSAATEAGLEPAVLLDPFSAAILAAYGLAAVVFPVLLGAYLGARRDLVQSLQERVVQTQAEQRLRVEQTRQAERTRIAREMHDVLAHRMSLVALHAGGLEVNPTAGPAEVEQSAALIRTTARQALEELRTVLGVLRADTGSAPQADAELLPQPTLADVDRLVRASSAAGVAVHLHLDLPEGQTPPPIVGRTAHRVVREALTNVHKHAAGGTATVLLTGEPGSGLQVRVHNSAPATAAAPLVPGAGLGLLGLRERVELVGGRLSTGAQPDGFLVHADLPWPDGGDGELA